MSSTRLPGKVLKPLAGEPVLARIMDRLAWVRLADDRLVATSDDRSDDVIVELCRGRSIRVVRGPLHDVLARYHQAATEAGAEVVVRITADCPLVDPQLVDDCISAYLAAAGEVDYVSNTAGRTFPIGLDVEVFSFAALDEAFRVATAPEDREHVTPYLIRAARSGTVTQAVPLGRLRWTLDYPDDYEAIARIYDRLQSQRPRFDRADVYRLLLREPSLLHTMSRTDNPDERHELIALIEQQVALLEPVDRPAPTHRAPLPSPRGDGTV